MHHSNQLNRRDLLKTLGVGAAALAASPFFARTLSAAEAGAEKKILFFTKSSGFQHSTITRKSANELAYAEQLLTDFGAKNGFKVTCSKDGSLFTPEYLAQFDAIAFYTTGDLTKDSDKYKTTKKLGANGKPVKDDKGKDIVEKGELLYKEPGMGDAGKKAFLDAIRNGKGFMAFHSGSDTFHSKGHGHKEGELLRDVNAEGKDEFDPYIQMLGGEFIIHGAQQPAILKTVDPKWPGAEAFNNASFVEEWYSLKNFAPDLHVILTQHCESMKGPMYERQPYPETWAHMWGKGRVFYTSMGHREDVWAKPEFQGLTLGALRWITGQVDVDVTPNIKEVTPQADPKQWASAKK
ncbi:MAG TPA: ThuA domain-containing protein [Tepidisphaeraceae bacterium]|nr:ThuA domain-containing protein [Tepidisphaeraceae bacterium]